jgi:hypothetical protein
VKENPMVEATPFPHFNRGGAKGIPRLVYKLYDLTAEEIAIVEGVS